MSKRFRAASYRLEDRYSSQRVFLRLNERNYNPHRIKPYGLGEHGFQYHQLFEKRHGTGENNRHQDRAVKKSARQRARRQLRAGQE